MKRSLSILFTLSALLIAMPMNSADAGNGFGGGHGGRGGHGGGHGGHHRGAKFSGAIKHHGFGHGFGLGVGTGVFVDDDDSDLAELYRELLNNVPYFALHPPVYYSYPVPRTYGYSPFAYGPWVMTPELAAPPEPVTIINPYVPKADKAPASEASDRSAAVSPQPEPLVIMNPYVTPSRAVAVSKQ